jgi:RNA exonuclease 1
MKRSQDSMTPSRASQNKKARVAPKQAVPQPGTTGGGGTTSEGEWTRVEKRKAKKTKKLEAKHDVCLISPSLLSTLF